MKSNSENLFFLALNIKQTSREVDLPSEPRLKRNRYNRELIAEGSSRNHK